ncbi:hypothetical protein GSI_08782 [Ganoderma sinense ZZ0214-1]|nr:hypothetical protein GSI_08782 [Ganoderma sinense ZZ0214-1]
MSHRSDINYFKCPLAPPTVVSTKQQRYRFRQRLLATFEPRYHLDRCVLRRSTSFGAGPLLLRSVFADQIKTASLLKRINSFGTLSIGKRASAFLDCATCDDVVAKVGWQSCGLNFLRTESNLFGGKFVTFEQY